MNRTEYAPGVCNIGDEEVAVRKRAGWWGLALTVALVLAFESLPVHPLWCLVLLVPSSIAAAGFIQASRRFCAALGWKGVMNFTPEIGHTDDVPESESRRRDRRRALQIAGFSLLAGTCVTLLAWILRQALS